ncbi:MAG: hypothetical protein JWN15_951 [Firmicutes bacterium]|nr:hypothetical protein [Bacillota bacterium]
MVAVSVVLAILWGLLWGLLWVLAGLVALLLILLLLILFLPFDIDLRLDSDWAAPDWEEAMTGAIRWRSRVRWGRVMAAGVWAGEQLSLTRSEVRICGIPLRFRPRRDKVRPARPKRNWTRKRKPPDLAFILAAAQESARLVRRLVGVTGIRVEGDMTYGFPDPAVTGWSEAFLGPWYRMVPVHLAPDFSRSALIGWAQVNGRIYGYQVAQAAWRVLDDPVIRDWLAEKIRFQPIRYWLLRGGKRQWRTSS